MDEGEQTPATTLTAGIVGPLRGPARSVRVSRFQDLARQFPGETLEPPVVAAALALLEGVPRVVIASSLDLLADDVAAVVLTGPIPRDRRLTLRHSSPLIVDLPSDADASEIADAKARGLRFVAPCGAVLLPGERQAQRVGGAALALPLLLGRPHLGPLCELAPHQVDPLLVEAGLISLRASRTSPRSAPRVMLPPGQRPIAVATPTPEAAPSGPAERIERTLTELTQRFSNRLERGPGAHSTLEREARRLLQTEVSSGAIKGYALMVSPEGADIAIEVVIKLPKRVGEVIVRVRQR